MCSYALDKEEFYGFRQHHEESHVSGFLGGYVDASLGLHNLLMLIFRIILYSLYFCVYVDGCVLEFVSLQAIRSFIFFADSNIRRGLQRAPIDSFQRKAITAYTLP